MHSLIKIHGNIDKDNLANSSSCQNFTSLGNAERFNFHMNFKLSNGLMLFFAFFSIIVSIGIPIELQTNYVFAQSRYYSESEIEDNDVDEDSNSLLSRSSETESKLDPKDPFTFSPHNKENENNSSDNAVSNKSILESSSASATSSQVTAQSSSNVYGDFNGDGKDDLAIGVPGENDGAGAVNVLYGSSNGLSATSPRSDQFWTQASADVNDVSEPSDEFGSSLNSGDFNGDGRDDLAIGVRGENDGAGAVNVLYGSSSGLSATSPRADQFWTQASADVNDVSESGDSFGFALASGDFNGDGRVDLAIGVPGENDGAGAVNVLYGSSNGLSATSPRSDQFWTQASADVDDASEIGDSFGSSLTSGDFNGDGRDDLAIGVSGEDVDIGGGSISGAGAVNVLYGSSNGLSATSPRSDQFWTQDSPDVNDVPEPLDHFGGSLSSGDFNGDGRDDLSIGGDGETVVNVDEAGAVNVIYGSSNGLSATSPRSDQFWTQDSPDVNDVSESGDSFGFALASGDFNGDGRVDLAIGAQFESVGSIPETGAVNVIYGSSNGLSATSPRSDQFWTQSTTDVNDVSEDGDAFSHSLFSADFNGDGRDDLAIGVPGENGVTGAVNVIYGSSNGLSATSPRSDQFWTQSTTDVNDVSESGDFFGGAVG